MSTTTVLYILEAAGNLPQALPAIAGGLDAVRAKAAQAASGIGGGLKAGIAAGRQALNSFADEAGKAFEGVAKVGGTIAAMGVGVQLLLSKNHAWQESTARLVDEFDRLGQGIADAVGPSAAKFLDAFTLGLVAIVTFLQNAVVPAFQVLADLGGVVKAGLVEWVTIVQKILAGDLAGAFSSIFETQKTQLEGLKTAWKDAQDGFEAAKAAAIGAAKATYERATDNKSDIPIKSINYTDEAKKFQPLIYSLYSVSKDLTAALPTLAKISTAAQEASDVVSKAVDKWILALQQGWSDPMDQLEHIADSWINALKLGAQQKAADAIAGFGSAAGGGLAGIASAYGGPIGALVGAVLGLVNHLPELITGLGDEALQLFVGLPDMLKSVFGEVLPALITDVLPQILPTFLLLPTQIGIALIQAAPALIAALVDFLPRAALEFAQAIQIMLIGLGSWFWSNAAETVAQGFRDALRDAGQALDWLGLGTHLGKAAAGHRSFLGIHIPKLDDGGLITRTGLALVHAGERYLGAPGSSTARATSGMGRAGAIFNIANLSIADARSMMDQIRRLRGSFGINARIDALA